MSRRDRIRVSKKERESPIESFSCLLYTSDAADERSSVDLGGRRIIKKKNRVDLGGGRTIKKKTIKEYTTKQTSLKL